MWQDTLANFAKTALNAVGLLDRDLPASYAQGATAPAWSPPGPLAPPGLTPAALDDAALDALAAAPAPSLYDALGQRAMTMEAVEEVLDEMVRPALNADGGDIALVKIEDDDIYVRLVGACSSCPSSIMTMKMGVERLLQDEFPQMRDLIQVDDSFA